MIGEHVEFGSHAEDERLLKDRRREDVGVGVNQPGQQRASPAGDDNGVWGNRDGFPYRRDLPCCDNDRGFGNDSLAVENANFLEDQRGFLRSSVGRSGRKQEQRNGTIAERGRRSAESDRFHQTHASIPP